MEKVGWDLLIRNDPSFRGDIRQGVDVLIASHRSHKSGCSQELMKIIGGGPRISILSNGSESENTDVESRNSVQSEGWPVQKPNVQHLAYLFAGLYRYISEAGLVYGYVYS